MPNDVFLDLKSGGITGESSDSQYAGCIEIDSWNFGGVNPADITSIKGGGGLGRVSMHPLNFTVKQTSATIHLFDRLVQGTHIPTAILTCRKAGGGQEKFYEITLTEAYVAAHQVGGSSGSDHNMESFSLQYGSVQVEHLKQTKEGTTQSSGQKSWDLRANKAS
jgi:type VI secretion system secreted protein Hcp